MSGGLSPAAVSQMRGARRGPIMFLEVARGLSAQAVVLGHSLNIFLPAVFMVPGNKTFYIQSFAVIIFFVLSGYLITLGFQKKSRTGDYGFGSYMTDRFARVVFPLLPAIALIIAADFLVFGGSVKLPFDVVDLSAPALVAAPLLLFNNPVLFWLARNGGPQWLAAGPVGSGAPLWSVVVEWWLYVLFGVIAFAALRKIRLGFGFSVLALIAASFRSSRLHRAAPSPLPGWSEASMPSVAGIFAR